MLSSLRTAAHRLPPRARACALLHSRAALDAYSSPPTVLSTAFLSTTHSISPLSPPAHSRPLHTTAARHPKAALHPKALPVLPDRQFAKSVFAENPAAKWLHESGIYKNSGTTPAKPIPRKTERTRVHVVNEKFVGKSTSISASSSTNTLSSQTKSSTISARRSTATKAATSSTSTPVLASGAVP